MRDGNLLYIHWLHCSLDTHSMNCKVSLLVCCWVIYSNQSWCQFYRPTNLWRPEGLANAVTLHLKAQAMPNSKFQMGSLVVPSLPFTAIDLRPKASSPSLHYVFVEIHTTAWLWKNMQFQCSEINTGNHSLRILSLPHCRYSHPGWISHDKSWPHKKKLSYIYRRESILSSLLFSFLSSLSSLLTSFLSSQPALHRDSSNTQWRWLFIFIAPLKK